MSYDRSLTVSSFRFGLDTRREELVSQPGTLLKCENAHITNGGEIAKRGEFVLDGNIQPNDNDGNQGTFGLETTDAGPTVFGSALPFASGYANGTVTGVALVNYSVTNGAAAGGTADIAVTNGVITAAVKNAGGSNYHVNDILTITGYTGAFLTVATITGSAIATLTITARQLLGQAVLLSSPSAPVIYQQLQHPALAHDLAFPGGASQYLPFNIYDATKHKMLAVVYSENFNGKAIVAANFADGFTFLYYNGSIIYESQNGVQLPTVEQTQEKINELKRQIKVLGWDATTDLSGVLMHTFAVSPPGDYFIPICSLNTSGTFTFGTAVVDTDTAAVIGARALASFQITAISALEVLAPRTPGSSLLMSLTGGEIIGSGSAASTATSIVAAINGLTFVHGFIAVTNSDNVHVLAPVTYGNYTDKLTVNVFSGSVGASTNSPTFTLDLRITPIPNNASVFNPNPYDTVLFVEVIVPNTKQKSTLVVGSATAQVTNNTGNVTYVWSKVSGDTDITTGGLTALNASNGGKGAATISFSTTMTLNTRAIYRYKIAATDTVPNTGTAYLTVIFSYRRVKPIKVTL